MERYYIDNEEFAKNDYELENIVYTGKSMLIFYSGNEEIKVVTVSV